MKPAIGILGVLFVCLSSASASAATWSDFLRGHWVTDCQRVGPRYQQTGYTFSDFSGPEFAMVHRGVSEFYDSKCTKLYSNGQVLGHLNLKALLTGAVEAPQKGAKIAMQIHPLVQYPFAFYDQRAVDEQNRTAHCGKTDWERGRAKDALQTTCAQEVRDYYETNWFSLEVTDPDHLRIGDKKGNRDDIHRWAFKVAP